MATKLGYASYDAMVQAAAQGQTIIDGGFLRTALIEVDNLFAQSITMNSGGSLQSANYSEGTSGWIITSNGRVEFENGIFRGEIHANIGKLTDIIIDGKSVFKGEINSGPLFLSSNEVIGNSYEIAQGTDIFDFFGLEYKEGSSKWIQNIAGTYNNIQFDRIWLYFSYNLGRFASITLYLNGVNVFYKYAGHDSNGNSKILTLDYDIQYTEILKGSKTFKLLDLPTSRPTIPNVVWNNNGVLSIT